MKREFEVGERIIFYYATERMKGLVQSVSPKFITVSEHIPKSGAVSVDVHRGQCRHIKKPRERQRLWISKMVSESGYDFSNVTIRLNQPSDLSNYIEFIEVKNKTLEIKF